MNLDQLEVLDTIVREGSFSGAAKELHRATSAVSYAVKTLEDSLGLELFDRSGRRAKLTAEGEAVLREARRVLERAGGLRSLAASLRDAWEARFSVVVDGVLPVVPVIRAVSEFQSLGLPTRLEVGVEYLNGVLEVFHETDVDAMVALDLKPEAGLSIRALPPVEMLLLAHANHPVSQYEGRLTPELLSQHVELIVSDSSRSRPLSPLLHLGSPHIFRLPTFAAKLQAMREGVGFGWLPSYLAAEELKNGSLKLLDHESGSRWELRPQLAFRREAPPGRAGRRFLDLLTDQLYQASQGEAPPEKR
jgi:DNA-binding transcriptional LysR family regulator